MLNDVTICLGAVPTVLIESRLLFLSNTMVTITRTPREPVSLAFSSNLPGSHTSFSSDYIALYHWSCLFMIPLISQ